MPKLHLKPTPEEEARRLRKKERKEKRKHRQRRYDTCGESEPNSPSSTSRKRARVAKESGEPERKWASSDEGEQYGPQPAPSSSYSNRRHKPDQDGLGAEINEMRFREKLFDACVDDERLDSLEAKLNEFAHVPDRWRPPSTRKRFNVFQGDDWLKMDPQQMDDEEYAEWVRMGMYRKTHAGEYEEQRRQKAAYAARLAEEKVRKEETARLEKAAEEERKQKKRERDAQRWECAREAYHTRWKALLASDCEGSPELFGFSDVPWPIYKSGRRSEAMVISLDDLTLEAISAFLLPASGPAAEGEKSRKDVLRETFLRFHPDKFEGRFMKLVREEEQAHVREGIGQVVRVLNTLI